MALCPSCQAFSIHSFGYSREEWKGFRLAKTQASAIAGCSFCLLLIESFQDLFPNQDLLTTQFENHEKLWIHLTTGIDDDEDPEVDGLEVVALFGFIAFDSYNFLQYAVPWTEKDAKRMQGAASPFPTPMRKFHVLADPGTPAAESKDVVGVYIPSDTLGEVGEESLSKLRKWIENCSTNHAKCRLTVSGLKSVDPSNAALPTRCVEVSQSPATGEYTYVLRETAGQVGSYITLSHRWTDETTASSTLVTNFDERIAGNGLATLPKVMSDVLIFAHRLGIRYVWIDSICIIQDSKEDVGRELLKMAEYYQQSYITVAATTSSVEHGLVPQKPPPLPPLVRLPYRGRDGRQHGYFYIQEYNHENKEQYTRSVEQSELLTRGWVFQEWTLSRRIVCFTPTGFVVQCQAHLPRHERDGAIIDANEPDSDRLFLKTQLSFDFSSLIFVWIAWDVMVGAYSGLQLTKLEQDRLVALAGIAREVKDVLTDMCSNPIKRKEEDVDERLVWYVAGHWISDLWNSLLWEHVGGAAPSRIADLPTWSWASLPSRVRWSQREASHEKAFKLKALVTADGREYPWQPVARTWAGESHSNPFGITFRFAKLVLQARMQLVLVRECFNDEADAKIAAQFTECTPSPSWQRWRKACCSLKPTTISGWVSMDDTELPDNLVDHQGSSIYAMNVAVTKPIWSTRGLGLGYLALRYPIFKVLLLRPSDRHQGCYERVGMGMLFGKQIERGFKDALEQEIHLV